MFQNLSNGDWAFIVSTATALWMILGSIIDKRQKKRELDIAEEEKRKRLELDEEEQEQEKDVRKSNHVTTLIQNVESLTRQNLNLQKQITDDRELHAKDKQEKQKQIEDLVSRLKDIESKMQIQKYKMTVTFTAGLNGHGVQETDLEVLESALQG